MDDNSDLTLAAYAAQHVEDGTSSYWHALCTIWARLDTRAAGDGYVLRGQLVLGLGDPDELYWTARRLGHLGRTALLVQELLRATPYLAPVE